MSNNNNQGLCALSVKGKQNERQIKNCGVLAKAVSLSNINEENA